MAPMALPLHAYVLSEAGPHQKLKPSIRLMNSYPSRTYGPWSPLIPPRRLRNVMILAYMRSYQNWLRQLQP